MGNEMEENGREWNGMEQKWNKNGTEYNITKWNGHPHSPIKMDDT